MLTLNRYARYLSWLEKAVELQLFLSLISLPLLIAWGLPFSAMTLISNLVFGPLLTLFLTISALIFYCEILGVSNYFLVQLLDGITHIWHQILSYQSQSWLIGFAKPHTGILCLIIATVVIIISKRTWKRRTRIALLALSLIGSWIVSYGYSKHVPVIQHIACNGGSIGIVSINNQTFVIDPGYIAQKTGAASWVQYTLAPLLIQTRGTGSIDHFIILQPSARIFQAIAALSSKIMIKNLYIPYWQGSLSSYGWHHFFTLQSILQARNTTIHRIGNHPYQIQCSDTACICITPRNNRIKSSSISFLDISTQCIIDKHETTFYAAKHTHNFSNTKGDSE